MSQTESVMVFPRSVLQEAGTFQGLTFECERLIERIFTPSVIRFHPREEAETDESLKQVIPYVLLIHDEDVLFYVRGKESGESRLVAKGSIGFGGHVKAEDDSLFHDEHSYMRMIYDAAAHREVNEELIVDCAYEERIVALLNDERDAVGRVHFGIVHVWKLENRSIRKRERQISQLGFVKPVDLLDGNVVLEGWSQICLDHIDQILKKME